MINIFVYDPSLLPLNALVYLIDVDTKNVLLYTKCVDGEIYVPEPSKFIDDGRLMIRIRYCTDECCFKPEEFYLNRGEGEDLYFCVRMVDDI